MFSILGKPIADRGYYINLDSSVNRKQNVERQIEKYDMVGLERFSALTHPDLLAASCTKSHLAVFKQADTDDVKTLFVAEDDFDMRDPVYFPCTENSIPFKDHLYNVMNQLESVNWDVFMFGYVPKSQLIPLSNTDNLYRITASTGGWAYLIKQNAYRFILKHSHYMSDRVAIDDWLPHLGYHGFDVLGSYPFLAHHAVGYVSTLQPTLGELNYNQMIDGFLYRFYDPTDKPSLGETLTVLVTASAGKDYITKINSLLCGLSPKVKYCKFIFVYDSSGIESWKVEREIGTFTRYIHEGLNREIVVLPAFENRIAAIRSVLNKVRTPYFLWLDQDWLVSNQTVLEEALRKIVLLGEINTDGIPVFKTADFEESSIPHEYKKANTSTVIVPYDACTLKAPKVDDNWYTCTAF